MRLCICLTLLLFIAGCSSVETSTDGDSNVKALYLKGKKALNAGDYEMAIEHFETLESRYPFGLYAQQAQLDIAYAYYKFNEPDSAISTADRFIKTYPRHDNVDYAYYLRGLASFKPNRNFFDRLFRLDPAKRDPHAAKQAFKYFSELISQYPDSQYTRDATQRMTHIQNYLARHEVYVARYYLKQGVYIAAVNRAQHVIENYSRTPSIPDALDIMSKAYQKLGIGDLSDDVSRVLLLNRSGDPVKLDTDI